MWAESDKMGRSRDVGANMDGTSTAIGVSSGLIGAVIFALIQAALTWRKDRAKEKADDSVSEFVRIKEHIEIQSKEIARLKVESDEERKRADEERKRSDECRKSESILQVRVARLETILESNGITYRSSESGEHFPLGGESEGDT